MSVRVGIETSTSFGSVAIGRGSDLLGEVVIGTHTRHARAVLPALDFLLRSAGVARTEIQGIVVGAGPGSFTGVRIAAATARGLAHGLGAPLYAWSSLAALAIETCPPESAVCVLFDARRGEVYAACYERDAENGRLATLLEPTAMHVSDLADALSELNQPRITYAGDGAQRYAADLGLQQSMRISFPRASGLLRLAAEDPSAGRVHSLSGWEPSYLRESGAERAAGA